MHACIHTYFIDLIPQRRLFKDDDLKKKTLFVLKGIYFLLIKRGSMHPGPFPLIQHSRLSNKVQGRVENLNCLQGFFTYLFHSQ